MKTKQALRMDSPRSPARNEKARKPHSPQIMRIYVKVTTDFDTSGMMMPKAITWTDGRVFPIEAVTDFRPAAALQEGHAGDCYTVLIHGERKHLFFQRTNRMEGHRLGRWWVEVISL